MMHLVSLLFGSEEVFGSFGLWAFLSVGAVALFGVFIPLVTWIENRRKERDAFYKSETIRRVAEASGDSAKATVELLREQHRMALQKTREGMKIAGIINLCVGIALIPFLRVLVGWDVALCGLIPGMIGIGMLVYVYILAEPLG
jgi:hypothetical protein